ncbi:MAG TPA: N,N'-diacetylchitobiose phosphorylase [Clostridiales bacterium]|nr:N,N'-diacetylchitobiose phosphorylase [Clostridiales bacterium]
MKYGYFDNERREYVIERVDVPVSWTNYIGTKDMCGVFNHTAGGYLFSGSPEYHRITRFRQNGVPMDFPGHYVYIRDNADGEYWSVSWQPVGKPLDEAKYTCRHGLSYSTYTCDYKDISAVQTLFVAEDDPVEIWDVRLQNNGGAPRALSVFSYLEFSFHQIDMDNRNLQMSLYAAGSAWKQGCVEYELHYEEDSYQFFTANFEADGYDCVRDTFIGPYRTERNPVAVERGECQGSAELGGNHCGGLMKKITLAPGEEARLLFLLGEGDAQNGVAMRKKYGNAAAADAQFEKLKGFWDDKLSKLAVKTPSEDMNTLVNIWTLYQSEINVMFSRFSSFIEVGGRTGLGYRDTAQDAMTIPHSNPEKCRSRILELLRALTTTGYGLHLFEPAWFEERKQQSFKSPTVIPAFSVESRVHGICDACSDDALWLIGAIVNYIKETGEFAFADEQVTYADGGAGSVYEHMTRILDFSARETGQNGICKGLRADWNDCLNLSGGESALVSFLLCWACRQFAQLADFLGRREDARKYAQVADNMAKTCEDVLWDGAWYLRGFTADNRKIGTHTDTQGRVHLESNTWAVLSGVAKGTRAQKCMDAVYEYLYTEYGLMLNAPPYTKVDDGIGFMARVYPGVKENGAIFSHPNPWAWAAEAMLKNGDRAMKYYNALSPYGQNDKIEVRQSEPYSYCQFVMGKAHTAFGRARHPFMTGTGGWAYFSATQYMLGVRPDFGGLVVDPGLPPGWKETAVKRVFRGAIYDIMIKNPSGGKVVVNLLVDGQAAEKIPVFEAGTRHSVEVILG